MRRKLRLFAHGDGEGGGWTLLFRGDSVLDYAPLQEFLSAGPRWERGEAPATVSLYTAHIDLRIA